MYNNTYSNNIAERVKKLNKKHIARQEEQATMGDTSFTSHLEGMPPRDPNVEGGSGYVEATLRDQGFADEATNGVVGSGEPIVKRKRARKPKKEVGGAILGLADIETEPRGDPLPIPPLVKSGPRASKSKLQDETEKPPPITKISRKSAKAEPQDAKIEEAKGEDETVGSGGAKKKRVNKYALLVKETMQKHNIKNLAEASKYIKEHNLYSKQ